MGKRGGGGGVRGEEEMGKRGRGKERGKGRNASKREGKWVKLRREVGGREGNERE